MVYIGGITMDKIKTNAAMESIGILALTIGATMIAAGKILEGMALGAFGVGVILLKYAIRDK